MTVRTILNNGQSDNRIDIVVLGDGYLASDIATTFTDHAQALSQYLFSDQNITQPFSRYKDYFNIHLIDVVSNESGTDIGPEQIFKDTALNSQFTMME